jgi:hypothetical protein
LEFTKSANGTYRNRNEHTDFTGDTIGISAGKGPDRIDSAHNLFDLAREVAGVGKDVE